MKLRGTLLLAGAGLALAVTPALGDEDAKPTPGCAGLAFTDPAGDQVFSLPLVSTGAGQPNTDVIAGWFTNGDDGLFANIQVSKLDATVDAPSTATAWYMVWTFGDATKFVKAETSGTDFTYSYGTLDTGFTEDGSTTGKVFLGDKGILRIKIPSAAGGGDGKKLASPYAHVTNAYSVPGVGGALGTADDAPDGQNGKTFTIGGCAEGAAAATPSPTPAPTTGAGSTTSPAKLDVTVSPGFASAKKVAKAKKLTLGLKAKSPLTAVTVALATSAGKTVATGKLAKLSGSGKVTLKVKGAPKAGAYKLKISAKTASGAPVSGTYAFKLKK